MKKQQLIPRRFPCPTENPSEASIIHTIPATWSNLKSFILNPKELHLPKYNNLSECLNTNWTIDIPHVNLTILKDNNKQILDMINKAVPSYTTYSDHYGIHGDTIFLLWNIILSILIVYTLWNGLKEINQQFWQPQALPSKQLEI